MTLSETIEYHEKKAKELERSAKLHQRPNKGVKGSGKRYLSCIECANEHRQLATWLKELKELRKNRIGRVGVGCANCIHMKTEDYTKRPCGMCCNNYFSKFEGVNADERDSN